jgi:phosphate-selective porin
LGRVVPFSGSDTGNVQQPAALLALAGVTNRSPYTRFSQAGGGQLEGFDPGEPGQYQVPQWLQETAFIWHGLGWQQELHWKQIEDRKNGTTTTLMGNYAQVGYFFHGLWSWVPGPLELALRHAIYDPNRDVAGDVQQEFSLALNWFFDGHLNKLTAEWSYFDFENPREDEEVGHRFRLQWDVSL